MTKDELRALLDAELRLWSQKPYDRLVAELSEPVAYERGEGDGRHQFEVDLLEHEADYLHIVISIDDAGFLNALRPVSASFILHRDGRLAL